MRVEPGRGRLGRAINSPVLLLRSGLIGAGRQEDWLHPVVAMGAFYEQRIEGFYGAPQSVASHHSRGAAKGPASSSRPAGAPDARSSPCRLRRAAPGGHGLLPHVCATISLMIDGFDGARAAGR